MALTTVRPQGMGFNTGRRNMVINGAMQVAQRGTSDSAAAHNSFIVDRFKFSKANVDNLVVTTSQSTDSPDGFSNSYKIEAATAESALDANDLAYVRTLLEAQNLQHLKYGTSAAEKVTASFWVKSSSAGQYTLTLYQDDGSYLVNKTYSIGSANTWEYKTITFPEHTTGAITNDNGFGLSLNWIILAGTDWTSDSGTQGVWGNYANAKFANGHTVTSPFMTTNGTFQITGVQLEVGENASDFEHRSFGEEQTLCQRYYYRTVSTSSNNFLGFAMAANTTNMYFPITFPTTMRSNPSSIDVTAGSGGNIGYWLGGAVTAFTSVSIAESGTGMTTLNCAVGSGLSAEKMYGVLPNGSGSIGFNAEL